MEVLLFFMQQAKNYQLPMTTGKFSIREKCKQPDQI
jgi:hypothetical protein